MPQISIIMPVYNTDKYLRRTLDALLNQTFGDIEIIAIDDGSTDDSLKILNEYAERDSRVVVITQKNSGPATARNKGLDAATGKYLMFCDSDDWYEPNMCQVMFDTIEKQKTDLVTCHNKWGFEENLPNSDKGRSTDKHFNNNWYGRHRITNKTIGAINSTVWNKIFKRDIIEHYAIRFPDCFNNEDLTFVFMYMLVINSVYFIQQPLYNYFVRQNSLVSKVINNNPTNKFDGFCATQHMLTFAKTNQLSVSHKKHIIYFFLILLSNINPTLSSEQSNQFIQYIDSMILTELHSYDILVCIGIRYIIIIHNKTWFRLCSEFVLYNIYKYTFGFLFYKNRINIRLHILKIERDYKRWLAQNSITI